MRGNGFIRNGTKIILLLVVSAVVLSIPPFVNNAATQRVITVPLKFRHIPGELIVSDQSDHAVTITLSEGDADIQAIEAGVFYINLTSARSGKNTIDAVTGELVLKASVSVEQISPDVVSVWMVPRVSRTLPVTLKMTGVPARGYSVTQTILTPPEVTVSGTRSFVESIHACMTKPIDISGLDESIKKEVVVDIRLPEGATITPSPVLADVRIQEKQIGRKFNQLPVYGDNSLNTIKVQPAFIDIDVRGTLSVLDAVDPEKDIRVSIDVAGLSPGVYVRRAKISLPVDLMLDTAEPEIFTVTVQ